MSSDVIDVAAGKEVVRRLSFADIPFQMDTVRVVGTNACRGRADSAMSPLGVWDQARTALTAAQVSASDRALASTVVRFDRVIDPVRDVVTSQDAHLQTQFAPRPWATLRPDSLRVDNGAVGRARQVEQEISAVSGEAVSEQMLIATVLICWPEAKLSVPFAVR